MVPALDSIKHIECATFAVEDRIGSFCPDEGFGVGVVAKEIIVDRLLQLRDACECTAPNALGRDLGEKALDEIEPGCAGGREVQMEAPVLGEPRLHFRRLVRPIVVEHEMEIEVPLHALVDPL